MRLFPLEHRRELFARDGRHRGGVPRAVQPDIRIHVIEEADAVAGNPMEAFHGVVLEIAVEQGVRVEPQRGIGARLLALQCGRLRELDRVWIRRDEDDLVGFRSKASLHDAFRQALRADHGIPGPVCPMEHKRIPGRRSQGREGE